MSKRNNLGGIRTFETFGHGGHKGDEGGGRLGVESWAEASPGSLELQSAIGGSCALVCQGWWRWGTERRRR